MRGNVTEVPRPVAYIAELLSPTPSLIDKIHRKHGVTFAEVREAVILTDVVSSAWDWDSDPARGWRLIVIGTTYAKRRLLVVLYPVDEIDGTWRLGTAVPDDV